MNPRVYELEHEFWPDAAPKWYGHARTCPACYPPSAEPDQDAPAIVTPGPVPAPAVRDQAEVILLVPRTSRRDKRAEHGTNQATVTPPSSAGGSTRPSLPSRYVSHRFLCDLRDALGVLAVWTAILSALTTVVDFFYAWAYLALPFSYVGWPFLSTVVAFLVSGVLTPGHDGPDDCPKRRIPRPQAKNEGTSCAQ
jgi:hypothetical protein